MSDRPGPAPAAPDPSAGPTAAPADLGAATTLLLVRHGRTAWTEGGRACGGETPGPPLSPRGEAEVRRLADRLAGGGLVRERPTAIVASPTLRTRQTADLLADALGVPVEEDEGWTEMRLGDWHGLGYAEVAEGWPERYRAWRDSTAVPPPGGESVDALAERVAAARDRTVRRYPGGSVLVACHVGPVRAVVAGVLEAGPAAFWRLRVSPASLSVVRQWSDGGAEVGGLNLA